MASATGYRARKRLTRFFRLGLRSRVVAALVATAAATLGVAALALLSPLEHKLRNEDVKFLTQNALAAIPRCATSTPPTSGRTHPS